MTLPQVGGHIWGCSCSVPGWRQAAPTHGQNATRRSNISLPCHRMLHKKSPSIQQYASLQRERALTECGRQARRRNPYQVTEMKPRTLSPKLRKYSTILYFCTIVSFFHSDIFSVVAVCGSTPLAVPVAEGDTVKAHSQKIVPREDRTSVGDSYTAGLTRETSQTTWGETPDGGEQLKQKHANEWSPTAHHFLEILFPAQLDTHEDLVHVASSPEAPAAALLEHSSPERNSNNASDDNAVDDVTRWSSKEENGSDEGQPVAGVGPSVGEPVRRDIAISVSSVPSVEAVRGTRSIRGAAPAGDATRVSTAGAATAATGTLFDVVPNSAIGRNAPTTVEEGTPVVLHLSSATPSEEGLPARGLPSAKPRQGGEPSEFDTPELSRRSPPKPSQLFTTLVGGATQVASSQRETSEECSPVYGEKASGVATQRGEGDVSVEADKLWMNVTDEVVPLATLILEAAEVAAPELLKRVQNASERESTGTSPEGDSYHVGASTAQEKTSAAAHLKDTLTKALQAALLRDVPGMRSLLLSAAASAIDPHTLSTAFISTREYDGCPTSSVEVAHSSVGAAPPVGQGGSKDATAARSTQGNTVVDMEGNLLSKPKSDRKRQRTSQNLTGGMKKAYRTRASSAMSEQRQSDTNNGNVLKSIVHRSMSSLLPLRRRVFKNLENRLLPRPAPKVTQKCTAREAEDVTKTIFRALKTSPSNYYRGLYTSDYKLRERWVWEFRPSYKGGEVVKLRASYAKAPAAFKHECEELENVRDGPRACASLRAAQDAMQLAGHDSELVTKNVDEVMKRMIDNSTSNDGPTLEPGSDPDAAEELAAEDALHLLEPNQAAELQKLFSSLGVGTGKEDLEQRLEGGKEPSLATSSSERPAEDQDNHREPPESALGRQVRRVQQGGQRSTDTMDTVTEVIDMTELGEVASFNVEAFLRQLTCGNLYSTLLLDSEHPRPTLECVIRSLTAHAKDVAERRAISTTSILVRIFTRIFGIFREHEIALDLLRSAQQAIADSTRTPDSKDSKHVANPGNLVNVALKSRPESIPFFVTLVTSMVVCQASLPYNIRPLLGYPVIPLARRVPLPAMQYLHRVGAFIELPPHAPPDFPLELQHAIHRQATHTPLQPWKRRLYKGLFVVWNLVYHMYHLGERPADFSSQNVDAVFPWPWRLTYVGSCLWSERIPLRNRDGTISGRIRDTLGLTVDKNSVVSHVREDPAQQRRNRVPPGVKAELTLPGASRDKCGPDATHKVVVESPVFARLDLRPEAAERRLAFEDIDFKKATQVIAEAEKNRLKNGLLDAPELLTDITMKVETCWLFKGTDSPKQWNLNAQLLTRRDDTFSRKARIHTGFSTHFHNSIRGAMERFIQEARAKGEERTSRSPYVILFAGHSLGGALAQLAAWYAAIHLRSLVENGKVFIFCISFGAPSVGDKRAYSEMSKLGIKFFRLKSDTDPVPVVIQDVSLSSLHSPDDSTLMIRSSEFTRIALRDHRDRLYFHGLLWSEDNLQPLRLQKWLLRLAASPMNLHALVDVRLHPMNSHMYIYACTLTLLAGAFRAAGWSSMCAAPLMDKWPLMPIPASPDMELEMQRAHGELPERVAALEETLGNIQREVASRRGQKLVVH